MKIWPSPVSGAAHRHPDGAADVGGLRSKFVAHVARGAHVVVGARTAALHYGIGDDAVECEAVVVACVARAQRSARSVTGATSFSSRRVTIPSSSWISA